MSISEPQSINLRIEGSQTTIFEDFILTKGHVITTASSEGCHCCNGRNGDRNTSPGPTPTTALDDASIQKAFTFDATYDKKYDDFLIKRIGPDTNTVTNYWLLYIDYQFAKFGGCQLKVNPSQKVLWAFGASENTPFLDLYGPTTVQKNQSTTFGVIDGRNGKPIAGATVRGQQTDAHGQVKLTFDTAGSFSFKATKNDTIRSPALNILVV